MAPLADVPRRHRRARLDLEANGEDSAAASLRERLDETLTVLRLVLPTALCRTFSTTNAMRP